MLPNADVPAVVFEGVVGGISEMRLQIAIGGTLLFVSLCLFLAVVIATWRMPRGGTLRVNGVIEPALSGPEGSPRVLDNIRLWFVIAVVLVVLAYGVPLWGMVADGALTPGSPPIGI